MGARIEISKEQLESLYVTQGLNARSVAEQLGCGKNTVLDRLRKYDLLVRPVGHRLKEYVPPEIYTHWTPDLAYAIGLLTADGMLNKRNYGISLSSTDEEIIELYCGCLRLSPNAPIYIQERAGRKPTYVVEFYDRGFRNFVEDIGLTPAKSKTIGPLQIPDAVFPDFLRGCWDGDGGWHVQFRRSQTQ
jgi:hypothetical protein